MSNILQSNKRFLLWASEIYIITVAIVVVSAWLNNLHPYELNLTVSKYIGLQKWTATLYFFMALLICLMLAIYIFKTKFRLIRKYVYFFVLLQILGCAVFPSMGKIDRLSTMTHKSFAYSLIFGIALSFVLMLIWGTTIRQKLYSIIGILYSIWFVFFYTVKDEMFMKTIFIWENLIILLLLIELAVEDTSLDHPQK
ncbi:MAG: hypothetical protein MJ108_02405 [Saccharofermentans sp.]|nr:hypothetical protein [Saccharofermentans sp.]